MISKHDLKQTKLLGNLTDDMLEKLLPVTDLITLDDRDVVFRNGDSADFLYLVKRGKNIKSWKKRYFVLFENKVCGMGSI